MNKASYPYRFPEQFKRLRKALALSQADLAERLGLDQTLLSKWEVGERRPSLESAMKICRLAGDSLDWLIFARGSANARSLTQRTISMPPLSFSACRNFHWKSFLGTLPEEPLRLVRNRL